MIQLTVPKKMKTNSTTKSADASALSETDSVPRIRVEELLRVLHLFASTSETTLENIRISLCVRQEVRRSGDALFSKARDAAAELGRLGLVSGGSYPKDRRLYERAKSKPIQLTKDGRQLLETFRRRRGEAYDELFQRLYAAHRYIRHFTRYIAEKDLWVPTISSSEQHISARYARHALLAEDVVARRFETDMLLKRLADRLHRPLTTNEQTKLRTEISRLVDNAAVSAAANDATEFAKTFLLKLNDIVIPILLHDLALGFDYRTHRALWELGREFRLWWPTSSHPDFDGWMIFRTATLRPSPESAKTVTFTFDSGLHAIQGTFLSQLYSTYSELHERSGATYIPAWRLRAVFCHTNHCQGSVFNKLFEQQFTGNAEYEIHSEIRGQWPQNEEPLRAGQRNIGTVRVIRK